LVDSIDNRLTTLCQVGDNDFVNKRSADLL